MESVLTLGLLLVRVLVGDVTVAESERHYGVGRFESGAKQDLSWLGGSG